MPAPSRGFTLIELLVAISILAVVGTLMFVDFGPFREEKAVGIAATELQGFIRLAQINATSGVLCDNKSGAAWSVTFTQGTSQIVMKCKAPDEGEFTSRTLNLKDDVIIGDLVSADRNLDIEGNHRSCTGFLKINFSHILGRVTYESDDASCAAAESQYAGPVLQKDDDKNFVIISKGGVVYVEQ